MENKVDYGKRVEVYTRYLQYWVGLIQNPILQEEVGRVLINAPDYFWTKGNYDENVPMDEHVEGGMIRRVIKGAYYLFPILEAWQLKEFQDVALAACLVHDCLKFGLGDMVVSKSFHGIATAEWIASILPEMSEEMQKVFTVVSKHDGRNWIGDATPAMADRSRMVISDWLALAIHTSDVVASRQNTSFQW